MYLAYAFRLLIRATVWLVLAGVLGLGASALAVRALQTWSTTAEISVQPSADEVAIRAPQPERYFRTQVSALLNDAAIQRTAEQADSNPAEIRRMLAVGGGTDSDVLTVTVTASTEDRSRSILDALLEQMSSEPTGSALTVISQGTPVANLPTERVIAAATGGTVLLAALLVLAVAAVRRPILDPRHVQLQTRAVTIYPVQVDLRATSWPDDAAMLRAWLTRMKATEILLDPHSSPIAAQLVDDLAALPGPPLQFTTPAQAKSGATQDTTRLLLHVVSPAKATEGQIENRSLAATGLAPQAALVVARGPRKPKNATNRNPTQNGPTEKMPAENRPTEDSP